VDIVSVKTAAVLKPNGIEPKLSLTIFSLNMDVGRFILITGIKKEAIRPNSQYSRHFELQSGVMFITLSTILLQPYRENKVFFVFYKYSLNSSLPCLGMTISETRSPRRRASSAAAWTLVTLKVSTTPNAPACLGSSVVIHAVGVL
jgi:hypothetical protein